MRFKSLAFVFVFLILLSISHAQTPTQIKQILPGTPSVVFGWTYLVADEAVIDSFVLVRTAYAATALSTDPYSIEPVNSPKTTRAMTHTIPSTPALLPGDKAFYGIVARKQGVADSVRSNIVEIDIVRAPPQPQNLTIARFSEVEFTRKTLNEGLSLWVITKLL